MSGIESALEEFMNGYDDGWAGQPVPKSASIEYRNAHRAGALARREADFYAKED